MTMIFERDENGLLHQQNVTLEEVAASGRNITLMSVQQWYVLFTQKEEDDLRARRAAAQEEMDKQKAEEDARKAVIQAEKDKLAEQERAVKQAERDKQAATDEALALALKKIAALEAKAAS